MKINLDEDLVEAIRMLILDQRLQEVKGLPLDDYEERYNKILIDLAKNISVEQLKINLDEVAVLHFNKDFLGI